MIFLYNNIIKILNVGGGVTGKGILGNLRGFIFKKNALFSVLTLNSLLSISLSLSIHNPSRRLQLSSNRNAGPPLPLSSSMHYSRFFFYHLCISMVW